MRSSILSFLRWGSHWIFHLKRAPMLFTGMSSNSYSGAVQSRKSKATLIADYLYLFFIRGMLPRNYKLWQFDVKDRREFSTYMDEPDSPFLRRLLYSTLWDDAYSILVNDKYLFHCYCQSHQIPTPLLHGVLRDGRFFGSKPDGDQMPAGDNPEKKLVFKPTRGTQGAGIHFVPVGAAAPLLKDCGKALHSGAWKELSRGEFVVEAFIRQHSEMRRINPHSVNTIRVITLLTRQNEVVPLAAILRTSSSERGTDNFSTGGIVVGIDLPTGKLNRLGFVKPQYGTTLSEHPLTRVKFEGFQIPFWPEVLDLLDKAQKSFHHLYCIGWDIAIGENGPIFIEGNIEWGTAGMQAATGGLLTERNRVLFAQHGLRLK